MASVSQIIRRRRRRKSQRQAAQFRTWNSVMAFLLVAVAVIGLPAGLLAASAGEAYARALTILPDPQDARRQGTFNGATAIYDSSEQVLLFAVSDPLGDERGWVQLAELPAYVGQATALWEDPDYFDNAGFNPIDVVDRLVANWLNGPLAPDVSLTGRLVRNTVLSQPEVVTVDDRALEYALVAEINRRYSAEEILEWHLNTNYYGNQAYGIEAAAQIYLGKSARDLTLDEAALLAAIPTAPNLNPVDNETAARGRQGDMLRRMLAADIIGPAQFEVAINAQTVIRPDAGQTPRIAPEFARYARRQAETILTSLGYDGPQMMARGGLEVITTLDLDLYYQADCLLRTHLARLAGDPDPQIITQENGECFSAAYLPALQPDPQNTPAGMPDTGAIVIMDVQRGEIKAMVGEATAISYQPGPTLHPFIYLDGFINADPNYTAASMLLDIPNQVFPGPADGLIYQPQNPDGLFRGPVSLRTAMGAGLLPPAVQVANILNLNNVLRDTIFRMGIDSLRGSVYDLSLLERGGTVSVLDMVYAYSIFAANGAFNGVKATSGIRNHDPVAVKRITDADGTILWEYDDNQVALNREPLLASEVAYLVNDILADTSTRASIYGPNTPLLLDRRTAVVNGITGDRLDNWTIGYTPQLIAGVRLGHSSRIPLSLPDFAVNGAAPVWRALIDYAHLRDNLPSGDWQRPDSIVQAQVCRISGGSPNGACDTRTEIFLDRGQIPPLDTNWQTVEINTETNQRATANTPIALIADRNYFIPPPAAMDWWQANNRPLPPEDYDLASRPDIFSAVQITQPRNLDIIGGEIPVVGSINAEDIEYYQLAYGAGQSPDQWINFTDPLTAYTPGDPLATWDTTGLDSGTYVIRLSVGLTDGTIDRAIVPVIVDNLPPQIVLNAGEPDQVFRWPQDEVIPLVAQVTDNIRYEQVDFYHNGAFVGSAVEAPFRYDHRINRTGREQFTAIAYDAAGNSTTTEIFVEVIR